VSRSKRPQCSVGRGCRCCGDAGEVRRARENSAQRADVDDIEEAIDGRHEPDDGYECDARDCPICGERVDAESLPPGVAFTEAA
jgi:hypothetical protein